MINNSLLPTLNAKYPGGIEFLYPDAPICLQVPDGLESNQSDKAFESENRAWWLNVDVTSRYIGLEDSLTKLAEFLDNDPIEGVIGFSQGGALAAMVTSFCESRTDACKLELFRGQNIPVDAFLQRLPEQGPLKFSICFSGFRGTMKWYSSFYTPQLSTPSCHIVGTLDAMVTEKESQDLINSFKYHKVLRYYGAHFVPRDAATMR
jgi:hypothetical protein